ncbi:putative arp2 3 complex subunit [Phaeomoniella chlamydospora]|uniref:Actin-related protein 2/3 complex subunit 5 n=1 Tax=Phaeomoniella chlamydospora TaxID=158046 RepID=A0A0G2EB52_PHACM|nr:putative arp2 3 complex subunit [Phaeomoniella chlamydospora]
MAQINYRTIDVDAYDPESSKNFPLETLLPATLPAPSTASEAASVAQQIRQLLRAGDSEGALSGVLETAPLGGDEGAKQVHTTTVIEVLQGIRQSDVSRVLGTVVEGEGGNARADTLMKYIYKGMATGSQPSQPNGSARKTSSSLSPQATGFSQIQSRNIGEGGGGQAMSVLLSWHEKLVEIVGVGGIIRVMSDRRTV